MDNVDSVEVQQHHYAVTEYTQRTIVFLGIIGIYVAYYYTRVIQKPKLFGKDGNFLRFVKCHLPMLREPFRPTIWAFAYHVQTIGPFFMDFFASFPYRSEKLHLPDGGEVVIDWMDNEDNKRYDEESRPTVIILPGITGSSSSHYSVKMNKMLRQNGYRSVVFNNRGFGGSVIKTPRTFCAANTDDLEYVVCHVSSLYPKAPLIAVGVSIGGMILFNYLAKVGNHTPLKAAMTISVAWNTFKSTLSLEKPINFILFNWSLAKKLTRTLAANVAMFEDHIDTDFAMKSKTIRQFDERFTTKVFGYETVDKYYEAATLHNKVDRVRIPTLCLSAGDDPFAPLETIPLDAIKAQPNVAVVVTSRGGHVGFTEGFLPRGNGYMIKMFQQFVVGVFCHGVSDVLPQAN